MGPIPKTFSNQSIAEFLQNIATAYEIKNKNRFEIIAYENAAESVITYPQSVYDIWKNNPKDLDNIPNIGPGIIKKLSYLFTHHRLYPKLVPVFKSIHPAVFTFTKINGIGPKIASNLTLHLAFPHNPEKSLEKLISYAQANRLSSLPRFGPKLQEQVLKNTLSYLGKSQRLPLTQAQVIARDLIAFLHQKFPDTEFVPLGSLRRRSATVGDIDIAAKSQQKNQILSYFTSYPASIQTIDIGPQKASIRLKNNIRIDIMVQPPQSWGSLLQHFTGSRQHNILLRRYALKLGYSLSEYGIKDIKTKQTYRFGNEIDFYHFLQLEYIKPENRIGENELEVSQKCYTKNNNNLR